MVKKFRKSSNVDKPTNKYTCIHQFSIFVSNDSRLEILNKHKISTIDLLLRLVKKIKTVLFIFLKNN